MILLGPLRIQGQLKLLVPVEVVAGAAELVVTVTGAGAVAGDVCRMGSDLVSDQAFAHILSIGQTEVLLRRHVTEHRRAMPTGHRRTDRRGDVVVTGSNVGDQGAEHIEGCFAALLHLLLHVELDLIEGNVAGTLHHHLHVVLPGATGQFTEGVQFSQLSSIRCIVLATGTQRVAKGEGAVVALEDLADVVKPRVERVLTVVIQHPLSQDAAAAADDAGDAAFHLGKVLNQQASVDGLIVDALLTVLLDDVEEVVLIELLDRSVDALKSLINRHGADRNGGCTDDRGAHLIEVDAAGGEIHHGIGAVLHRQLQLLHLLSGIRRIRRGADVGVHLALAGDADRHRLQIGVVDVGRDDHSPPGHLFHHQRFGQVLPLRHMGHFFGDHALTGVMHLRDVGLTLTGLNPGSAHDLRCDGQPRGRRLAVDHAQALPCAGMTRNQVRRV